MYVRTPLGMQRLRRKARAGDSMAASNLAAEYRKRGRPRLAYRWWVRAAELEPNGDDLLEVAYCLHHRVGVAKDRRAARRAYERAVLTENTTAYGHEEACYHLATLLLESRSPARRRVVELLREASRDGDYPEAELLLEQVRSNERPLRVCHCRRHLAKSLGRCARCRLHRDA